MGDPSELSTRSTLENVPLPGTAEDVSASLDLAFRIEGVERATRKHGTENAVVQDLQGMASKGGAAAGGDGQPQRKAAVLLIAAEVLVESPPETKQQPAHKSSSCIPFRQSRRVAPLSQAEDPNAKTQYITAQLERLSQRLEHQGNLKVLSVGKDVSSISSLAATPSLRHALVMISGKLASSARPGEGLEQLRSAGLTVMPVLMDGAEGTHTWRSPFVSAELLATRDLRGRPVFRKNVDKLREELLLAASAPAPDAAAAEAGDGSGGRLRTLAEVQGLVSQSFMMAEELGKGTVALEVLLSHLHQRSLLVKAQEVADLIRSPDASGDGTLKCSELCSLVADNMGIVARKASSGG
mmetsp:Transcript_34281/g.80407  ORF Transcript_34281/g.80407 Transcript_34281/m.80407 type:complete len:354 (+) Transcript_34281:223-1284(+)